MKSTHAAVFAMGLALHSHVLAASYELTAIPLPTGATGASYPVINQEHEIALSFFYQNPADPTGNSLNHPYAGTLGNLIPLPLPTDSNDSTPLGINDSGQIVGYTNDRNGTARPALWSNGTVTTLNTGTMPSGVAWSINNSGQIAGEIGSGTPDFTSNAAIWNGTTLADLGNYGAVQTTAIAINSHGQILITASDQPSGSETTILHDNASDVTLAPLGSRGTFSIAINDLGKIASSGQDDRTYVWQNGTFTLLDAIPNELADFPWAMNNDGAVVGTAITGDGNEIAIMWQGTSVINLNTLLPTNSGWRLEIASGITDDGTIVGIGFHDGQDQAFLLTPTTSSSIATPEPASLSLLAAATPLLLTRRRPTKK